MKTKAIIISQESKRLRFDSCHSEEPRLFRDDEEPGFEILRPDFIGTQNDKHLALSFCGGGDEREAGQG